MNPRFRLYLLVVGALTPMAVFAILVALTLVRHERETIEHDAIGRAHAAMSAVDAHLRGSIVSLEILGASKNLESGDIAAFHQESQRVLRVQPAWVNIGLATSGKVQLFNAVYALGKPEPFTRIDESFDAVVRTGKPQIGGVVAGTAVQSPTARVRIPVAYQGELRYTLAAPLNLKYLSGRSPEGWFQGHSAEGRSTYMSYVTSPLSGWALGITIPAATVEAEAQHTFAMLGAGVLLAFAIGMFLAWLIARQISQ
jgi:hypothetical protein